MPDYFISYTSADRAWGEWIAWQLESAGYTTVFQAWDIRPGANFVMVMQQATLRAHYTIAVLSPDYLAASFTQPEWAAAFAQDPLGEKGLLIPIRVRECDLAGLLPQIVYIDLDGVEHGRSKPATVPSFPRDEQLLEPRPKQPGRGGIDRLAFRHQKVLRTSFDQHGQHVAQQYNVTGKISIGAL